MCPPRSASPLALTPHWRCRGGAGRTLQRCSPVCRVMGGGGEGAGGLTTSVMGWWLVASGPQWPHVTRTREKRPSIVVQIGLRPRLAPPTLQSFTELQFTLWISYFFCTTLRGLAGQAGKWEVSQRRTTATLQASLQNMRTRNNRLLFKQLKIVNEFWAVASRGDSSVFTLP